MFSNPEDGPKIEDMARKFFQFNYSSCNIKSATLQNKKWYVEGTVILFGIESSKKLVIDSKTGKIISCN